MTFHALFGSELRRFLARRALRWTLAGALAVVTLTLVINAVRSTGTGFSDHTMYLRKLWFEAPDGVQETATLSVAIYLMILGVVLAATGVGGDYRAGTLGTLLTWEPRRLRLAVARLVAIATGAVGLYAVVMAVFVGGWWIGASVRGSTSGLGPDFWTNLAAVIGRGAVGVLLLAMITAGLALVTRGTVGALGVWFAYLVGIEGILAGRLTGLRPHLLLENLAPFLQGASLRVRGGGFGDHLEVAPGSGLVTCLILAAIVTALGVLAFRARDVT